MEKAQKLQLITSALDSYGHFEELLVKHLNSLYSTALRLTGSKEKAEDLVQESSLRAFKRFDQLEDLKKVKSWFLQILFNAFRDNYKKQKRQQSIVDIELTEELVTSASLKAYDQEKVLGGILEDEMQEALYKLPAEFRSVIILSDLEDCSYQEISDILSCPLGTVASRLFRARELLRKYLEDYAKSHGFL